MSIYGCICEEIKITALINPQVTIYCLNSNFKLQKKMSVFNKSETAHVTFDPVSINASEKEVLLPAFYLKQRDVGQEVLPMQSLPESFMQLLLIHWKTVHMDFMYSFQNGQR